MFFSDCFWKNIFRPKLSIRKFHMPVGHIFPVIMLKRKIQFGLFTRGEGMKILGKKNIRRRIRLSEESCISVIFSFISFVPSIIPSARRRISVATMWKFFPASPALEASSSALKAIIFAWSATELIRVTISQMFSIFSPRALIPEIVS